MLNGLEAVFFYLFAFVAVAAGVHGHFRAQSRAFGAVPDPHLLQRGRPVHADRRRVPGDDPARRLCRRGRGAVPVRRHDARRRFRRAEARRAAICAGRRDGRADPRRRADRRARRLCLRAGACRRRRQADPGSRDALQHGGARRHPLHGLHLLLPDRRPGAAGRHDRRHRADAAPQGGRQAAGDRRAGRAHAGDRDRGQEGRDGEGHLMSVGICTFPDRFGDPVHARRVRHLPEPQERHRHPDVGRADPARRQHQLRRLLGRARRSRRPGLRAVRADGRGRRSGDRPCHPRRLLPQPRLDRGRRRQHDEGLTGTTMYQAIVFLPLLGFLIAGLFGGSIGAKASEYITSGFLVICRGAVVDRLLHGRLRRRRGLHRAGAALHPVRQPDGRLGAPHRHADRRHAGRRQHRVGAGPHLFDRLHAPRSAPAALLRLSVAVHLRHADAGDGRQSGADVLRLGRRRPRLLSADRLLVQEAVGQRRGDQGLRRQPRRRFRLRARHLRRLRAVRLGRASTRSSPMRRPSCRPKAPRRRAGAQLPRLCARQVIGHDRRLPAAVHGRHGQVGAGAAAHLAAGRHGRPDAGLGADPCRDHGDRRRVHAGAAVAAVRAVAYGADRGDLHRRHHRLLRGDRRPRPERHQARHRLFDLLAARLHVRGARRRRLWRGDLPPVHARLLQGAAVPRLRLGHPCRLRRAGHAQDGRPAGSTSRRPTG